MTKTDPDVHTRDNAEATIWATFEHVVSYGIEDMPARLRNSPVVQRLRQVVSEMWDERARLDGHLNDVTRARLLDHLASALTDAAKANIIVSDFLEDNDDRPW